MSAVIADLAALASLFLFAAILPIYVENADRVRTLQNLAPAIGAVALGIGGFLSLAGSALWNWASPDRGGFRTRLAEKFPATLADANSTGANPRLQEEVATAAEFLALAPPALVEWVRRRRDRYSNSLSAALAIVLGLFASYYLDATCGTPHLLVTVLLVCVAAATVYFGRQRRHEAEVMTELWLRRSLRRPPV